MLENAQRAFKLNKYLLKFNYLSSTRILYTNDKYLKQKVFSYQNFPIFSVTTGQCDLTRNLPCTIRWFRAVVHYQRPRTNPNVCFINFIDNGSASNKYFNRTTRAYPVYAVGDYTSGGQQYYTTTTTNYSNSPTSSGSHGANNYLPVDESLLTRGDSPQTISGVRACEFFPIPIIILNILVYRMCLIYLKIHRQPQQTRNRSALPVYRMPLGFHRPRYVID